MGIDYAIDALHDSGWSALDTTGCEHASDGRLYPGLEAVRRTFEAAGHGLSIEHLPDFDCYRAAWTDESGNPGGAVVAQSEKEAAVFALAQHRRSVADTLR